MRQELDVRVRTTVLVEMVSQAGIEPREILKTGLPVSYVVFRFG